MTTSETVQGIDVGGRVIVLDELQQDLIDGGVPVPNGLTISGPPRTGLPPFPPELPDGTILFTYDDEGNPADLPPEAVPIVEAYSPSSTKPVP